MTEKERECLIDKMADNLPMFRARLNLSQEGFSNIIGVSRYTLLAIEKKQRKMTWNTFLSCLLILMENKETRDLLEVTGVYTEELSKHLNLSNNDKEI